MPTEPGDAAGGLGDPLLQGPPDRGHALDRQVVAVTGGEVDVGLVQRRRLDQRATARAAAP